MVVVGHLVEDKGVDPIMEEDTTMVVGEEIRFSHVGKLVWAYNYLVGVMSRAKILPRRNLEIPDD